MVRGSTNGLRAQPSTDTAATTVRRTAYRCTTRVRCRAVFEDRKAQRGRLGSVRWRAWLCWKLPKFLKELEKRSYIRVKETKGVPFIVAILTDNLPQAIQGLQRMSRA